MKEIQGKIKFGVIDFNYIKKCGFIITDIPNKEDEKFILANPNIEHWYISVITEEQASKFVEKVNYTEREIDVCYKDYNSQGIVKIDGGYTESIGFDSAKESLISLLKANDVWIKEWLTEPRFYDKALSGQEVKDEFVKTIQELDNKPDDLLLIKLT